ncbi:cytochrome P450 [Armillaria luteobubalina]|uniref:Cytochrome P450 n=1 Tax=Armillaria luteobubalina TaxID=153913 RepID=A0AA39UMA9_9AGAR|nr:cytochrome P450 [Armillaria luteobubalina]
METVILLFLLTAFLAISLSTWLLRRRRSVVKQLRGPPSNSWLLGHEYMTQHQDQVGDLEYFWYKEYGTAYRAAGCYGQDILYIADPEALRYITQSLAIVTLKRQDHDFNLNFLLGRGIVTAAGSVHQRHKKVMSPAFSPGQLRTFSSLFQRTTGRFSRKLTDLIEKGESTLNIKQWLGKLTLDIIGESAFGYQYGGIDDDDNELARMLNNLFHDAGVLPSRASVLISTLPRVLPTPLLYLLSFIPSRLKRHYTDFNVLMKEIGRQVLKQNLEGFATSSTGKDILSILARANAAEEQKKRLSDDGVLAQVITLTLAGHETTASTLTWLLYELCNHPEQQNRIRQEIAEVRARVGAEGELCSTDYDSMPFMNAVIKETLRFHPINPAIMRVAGSDDVIPLLEPVTMSTGAKLTRIPVKKGQLIQLGIGYYNRHPTVWGPTANVWNPDRFLGELGKTTPVGVYANLLSFSAGVRSCIGWLFAVVEMQAIVFELLESFEFSLPQKNIQIKRQPASVMLPMVREEMSKGTQMPLHLTPIKRNI